MRNILWIAILCVLISSMVGCSALNTGALGENNTSDIPANDAERSEFEGAVMKYVSSTDKSLTVELTNNTDSVWQSGNMRDYVLEYERDGKWYMVDPKGDFANTMELMLFGPGETLTHTFDFAERYGTLASGKYRVVKSWWANASETREAGEFYLACEFTVE